LRLLLGLASPTSGTALVLGRRYADLAEPARSVGAVLEHADFVPTRSGRAHLRVLALASGIDTARVDEVLDLVELTAAAERKVGTYSLGMAQRLGLAAALLGDPALLVLDEPINGLDPAGVHWLRGFLRRFADLGGAALVSSHVLAEVEQSVDRVLIINAGRLLGDFSMSEISRTGQSLEQTYLALTAAVAS
jgi:ABC-2 type transport system ATP-binding protein